MLTLTMDSVKEWVINKCKLVINDDEMSPGYTNVVTPNNIPAFTIPRTCSLEQQRRSSKELKTDLGENCSVTSSTSGSLSSCSPCRSPTSYTPPPNNDFLLLPMPSMKHPQSAPVSPSHSPTLKFGDEQSASTDDVYTNADPQSLAAMGLAHFKTKTPFGFDTLKQAPHTRRKESLFHNVDSSETGVHNSISTLGRRNFSSCDTVRVGLSIPGCPDQPEVDMERPPLQRAPSSRRRNIQSLVSPLAMLTTPVVTSASANYSPGGSPSHGMMPWSTSSSPVSTPDAGTKIRMNFEGLIRRASSRGQGEPKMRSSIYRRRRSSLPGLNENSNLVKTYGFRVHGRSVSECTNENNQNTINGAEVRMANLSANSTELQLSGSQNSLSTSCSCHSVRAANPLAEFGELKFSVLYMPESRQLRVLLIRAEHLVLNDRNDYYNINPFAKVCLMPGKLQKQTSTVVKHTTDPIFNEEFYFSDIDADQLRCLRLRIKIQNKAGNLRRAELIGEVIAGLGEFDLFEEQRMWKKLERKNESDELGFMQLRLCFEPKDARLSITIGEIANLTRHKIHGTADAYVKIELIQQGRTIDKKKKQQTHVKKKTLNPVFNQTFTFDVSPRIEDLNYTSIVLTVCNHERLRHDDVIGQVKLGVGATEETELQHWGLVIQNPEQEFTEVHRIMEPDSD